MKRSDRANALKKLLPIVTVVAPAQQSSMRGRLLTDKSEVQVKVLLPAGSRPHGKVSVALRAEPKTVEAGGRGEPLAHLDYEAIAADAALIDDEALAPKELKPYSGIEEARIPACVEQSPGLNDAGEKIRNQILLPIHSGKRRAMKLSVAAVTFYDQVYGKVTFEPNGDEPASIMLNDEIELSPVLNPGKDVQGVGLDH